MEKTKRPTGRPSGYSEKIGSIICARIADGESLRMICADAKMPGRRTVLDWLDDDRYSAFRAKYARARENQADYLEEEMCDIERDTLSGKLDPKAARVVLGSKQWRAEKLAPKKYGNRLNLEGSGEGGALVVVVKDYTGRKKVDDAAN